MRNEHPEGNVALPCGQPSPDYTCKQKSVDKNQRPVLQESKDNQPQTTDENTCWEGRTTDELQMLKLLCSGSVRRTCSDFG